MRATRLPRYILQKRLHGSCAAGGGNTPNEIVPEKDNRMGVDVDTGTNFATAVQKVVPDYRKLARTPIIRHPSLRTLVASPATLETHIATLFVIAALDNKNKPGWSRNQK
jgi:hypothetical protein